MELVIDDDEVAALDECPEIRLEEEGELVEVVVDTEDVSILPWMILESEVLPEAFQMSMACIVPYFFESILKEADVDFSYTEMEGSVFEPDREYSSAVMFYIQRKDLSSLFRKIRTTGAFDIYDVIIQLPEQRDIILQHENRLGLAGFEEEECAEMRTRWKERLEEIVE